MTKVLKLYMVDTMLGFDHEDFLTAFQVGIPPLVTRSWQLASQSSSSL